MSASTNTIRLPSETYDRVRAIAKATGRPMSGVIEHAIDRYERERFFDEFDHAFAVLRADPRGWRQELAERAAVDRALGTWIDES